MDSIHTDKPLRSRAQQKFITKQLEMVLFNSFHSTADIPLHAVDALIDHYQTLYPVIFTSHTNSTTITKAPLEDLLSQLKTISAQLHSTYSTVEPTILVIQLYDCLNNLKHTIAQQPLKNAMTADAVSNTLFTERLPDVSAWIAWLGDLICNYRCITNWEKKFCQELSNAELKELARTFNCKKRAAVINSIFYFKLHPEELLKQGYSADQLLHTKKQLEDLHDNVKRLFCALKHSCWERCQLRIPEYIFQGSELPEGMHFVGRSDHARSLARLLHQYPLELPQNAEIILQNPIHNILRAFKFWFNPSRLVDAIIGIWNTNEVQSMENGKKLQKFSSIMQHYYQGISTSECINIFGYLSNKSSQYFIRSLHAAANNSAPGILPTCSSQDKKTIQLVASLFMALLRLIQEELHARNITTKTVDLTKKNKYTFQPGKRNVQAITHILLHYSTIEHPCNKTLESLFDTIECDGWGAE